MGRIGKKILYKAKDFGEFLLEEGYESLFYGLYLVATPISIKMTSQMPLEEYYSQKNLRQKVYRLYRKGYIGRIGKGKNVLYQFNKNLRHKFLDNYLDRKAEKLKTAWDKKWRLVIYDIPEKKKSARDCLRKYLIDLGFGRVQDSCWVSPYDFSSEVYFFSLENGIKDYVCIYKGEFFAGKELDKLVEDIWSLNSLYAEYKSIVTEAKKCIRGIEIEGMPFELSYRKYCSLFSRYKELLLSDAFLPKDFSDIWKVREKGDRILGRLFYLSLGTAKLKTFRKNKIDF